MIPSLVDTSLDFGLFRVVRPYAEHFGKKCQNDVVHRNVTSQMYVFCTARPRVVEMKYDVKLQNYTFPMIIIFLWEENKSEMP